MKIETSLKLLATLLSVSIAGVLLLGCQQTTPKDEEAEKKEEPVIHVPVGFELDELYRPSDHDMGTWVSLAEGKDGQMFACDQWGDIYQFARPALGEVLDSTEIDSVDLDIGYAHGMLWAFNSLYVAVNRRWADTIETGSGIYRLTDSDADGKLDHKEMLLELEGDGEHGPHSFLLSPQGDQLYFIAGNHTIIPEVVKANSRVPTHWAEDNLLPPFPDARGHATEIRAPGGWVARFDSLGNDWELMSAGYRNAFDFDFNEDGELFVFDADMEWDFGMPWYRPIRICHATSGSEFGWRTGTGKWPTYYPDALPSVIDLGQGSPTGVLFGAKLAFPSKYQQGLFVADWSFGTLYFIDIEAKGSSYIGTKEEFLYGVPFPLTDLIAGSDGHLYFATGGRKLASRFYRLRYKSEVTSVDFPDDPKQLVDLRVLRKKLEDLHTGPQPGAVTLAWTHLDHEDRFVRYAARVALEHQPVERWKDRFSIEKEPTKLIPAALALARCLAPDQSIQTAMLEKLVAIDWEQLSPTERLDLLRTFELIFCRMEQPALDAHTAVIKYLYRFFPSENLPIDRETAEILIYLRDPVATEICLDLMKRHTDAKTTLDVEMLSSEVSDRHERYGEDVKAVIENMPPAEAIYYAVRLSHADTGWTHEMHEQYFQWFFDVLSAEGGLSFKAFMENIRLEAMKHVPEDEKQYFEELSGVYSPAEEMANLPQPEGPGSNYNASEINRILRMRLDDFQGNIENGRRIYRAALCESCHRMQGQGGISGPDLSQIHTRFERNDIVNAIFSPSDEISDQYAFTLFSMNDGKKSAGKIFSESDETVTIMPNPYTSTLKVELAKSEIVKRGASPVSPMPPGLLNRLNEEEITELFAYLLSGGNPNHYFYGGDEGREESD